MAQKTYWTKCGRQFKKNSTADVTGYKLDLREDGSLNDILNSAEFKECQSCPFKIKVSDGWPNPIFKRWECRAGSKPPNHKNDWVGSTENKLTIQIMSLDNNFLEAVMKYCEEHPDLLAGYNQDIADCRRVISVSCSQNKKGIAAKKALIEKFFTETEKFPDKRYENKDEALSMECEKIDTGCAPNNPALGMCASFVKKEDKYLEQKFKELKDLISQKQKEIDELKKLFSKI